MEDNNLLDQLTLIKTEDTFTASNGVVLKLHKVPRMIIAEAGRAMKYPKPPVVFIEDKGREEENPNDPDYIEQVSDINWRRGKLAVDTHLALGTSIISIPQEVYPPESDEWHEWHDSIGLDVGKSGKSRYVNWLKLYALNDNDFDKLTTLIMRYSGSTSEQDVKQSIDSFRNNKRRNSVDGVPVTETD